MNRKLLVGVISVMGLVGCDSTPGPAPDAPGTGTPVGAAGNTGKITSPTSGVAGSPTIGSGTAAGTGAPIAPSISAGRGAAGVATPSAGVGGGTALAVAGAAAGGSSGGLTTGGSSGALSATGGSGAPSAGAGGGSSSAAGSGGDDSNAVKQGCLKDPSNVVFVGDSYINYIVAHPELNGLVADRAIKDGALKMGQNYVDYAVAGTTIAAGAPQIPGQWTQAKAANKNIQLVIMDGGGNDVLINNMQCKNAGAAMDATCQMVVAATLNAGKMMLTDMKASGVTEAIWFFYPHAPTGGAEITDYTLPMLKAMCAGLSDSKFQCRIVDTIAAFDMHPDYYASDSIHANATGEGIIADMIYKQMKDDCAAQPATSGCCTP
jgi:hypothetical protein